MHDGLVDQARTWATIQSLIANNLQITTDADSANDAVRKSLLDTTAQTRASENSAEGTSGEAIAIGNALYLKASDGKLWKGDADADESTYAFVGVALSAAVGADETVRYAKPGGIVTGLSGLTINQALFISSTAGALSSSPHATRFARVARALSTTSLLVEAPKFVRYGTQAVTSATTYAQTTGFFPRKIRIEAALTSGANRAIATFGDESNTCIAGEYDGTNTNWYYEGTQAFKLRNGSGGGTTTQGTLGNRSNTGFDIVVGLFGPNITIRWCAEN